MCEKVQGPVNLLDFSNILGGVGSYDGLVLGGAVNLGGVIGVVGCVVSLASKQFWTAGKPLRGGGGGGFPGSGKVVWLSFVQDCHMRK